MNVLYPNFLDDPDDYAAAERLWLESWTELVRVRSVDETWTTPWLNTRFKNGQPFMDGNPIFSAVSLARRLGVRVIQLEPQEQPGLLSFWTGRFGSGKDAIYELVISCVLTEDALFRACDMMRQWAKWGEVSLQREAATARLVTCGGAPISGRYQLPFVVSDELPSPRFVHTAG